MKNNNNTITYNELTQTIQGEASAETEIVLPDYCPNIMKLIRTEAEAFTRSQTIRADRAYIEGIVEFRILYISENDNNLQTIFHQVPFSYSTEIKNASDLTQVKYKTHISYANTRALSPQKLYVKATVETVLYVFTPTNIELLPDEKRTNVILKTEKVHMSDITQGTQKILKISKELEPDEGSHPLKIVRYEYNFGPCDKKTLNNKIIAKSDLTLRVTYTEQNKQALCYTETKIPISQVLELSEATEENKCSISMSIAECHLSIKEINDKQSLIDCDIEILISADCFGETDTEIPTDAFSVNEELTCTKKQISVQNVIAVNEHIDFRETIQLESATNITDISVIPDTVNIMYDSESHFVVCRGLFTCSVLYKDEADEMICTEKSISSSVNLMSYAEIPTLIKGNVISEITSVTYTLNGNSVEIRICGNYLGNIICKNDYQTISDIILTGTTKENVPKAVVYYANAGEKIWDIAKKYSASPEEILKYNNISTEVLTDNKMIFISRI